MRLKLIPTLMAIPAFLALIALGVWQLQRLEWKETLIDRLQTRAEAPPESLPPRGELPIEEWEFRRVTVTGHFLHEHEFHLLNRSLNGNPGVHVLTPLRRTDVTSAPPVLINSGWVPLEGKDKTLREEGLVQGEVTVEGIVRFQRPMTWIQSAVLPEHEPQNNMWYAIDRDRMAEESGLELAEFYIVDGNTDVPGTYPVGKQWTLDIRNDHLQYAITWFLMAGALAVIFVLYHRQAGRNDPPDPHDTRS
jgi:surfeit locus 1 family protein